MAKSAEYALLTIIVLVVTYLVITPIANKTAQQFNKTAELIQETTDR